MCHLTYPSRHLARKVDPEQSGPLALFGGPLTGDSLVRNIYTDEAGISAHEPITVVVGLIVHADSQWFPAAQELARLLLTRPPPKYREGLVFHAKSIAAQNKYPGWSESDRQALMRAVMGLPVKFGISVAFGAVARGHSGWATGHGITTEMNDHVMAFCMCMGRADHFLRTNCGWEVAQLIAEDNQKMRRHLNKALHVLRVSPLKAIEERSESGKTEIFEGGYEVQRIVDEVHFMERGNSAPFLQIADACAYGIRRYLASLPYGADYMSAIAPGIPLNRPDFTKGGRVSSVLFRTNPDGTVWQPSLPARSS
jgi:hypothetical protein